jgi:hypothetical protein
MHDTRDIKRGLRSEAVFMAASGLTLGLVVLRSPTRAARFFGLFPLEHLNSTAVTMVNRPELRRASVTLALFAGGVSALWARYFGHVRTAARGRP